MNVQKVLDCFQKEAAQGLDIESMLNLADIYKEGIPGVEKNLERAITLYKAVLKLDPTNVNALLSLENLLSYGPSLTEEIIVQAADFFRRALEVKFNVKEKMKLANILANSRVRESLLQSKKIYEELKEYPADLAIRVEAKVALGRLLDGRTWKRC